MKAKVVMLTFDNVLYCKNCGHVVKEKEVSCSCCNAELEWEY